MAAPNGNQFWKIAANIGRPRKFETPEKLWKLASEYFMWCDEHPWKVNQVVKAGDHFGEQVSADTARPYTYAGLCLYLGIMQQNLNNYANKEEFQYVVNKIKETIYTQKFEGAAVGSFNANIIARDLGLTDKQDVNLNNNTTVKLSLSDEDRNMIKSLLSSIKIAILDTSIDKEGN